jgi:hypothetical protein
VKFKVNIDHLVSEQNISLPAGSEIERGVERARLDRSERKKAKRPDMPDLLSDFRASGENRGKLQLSLEFLDDATYKKLSKAAREEDINEFTRIVRNSEENVFKKKKELIGVIAGLDAATVPLGIKWYKDIAIGFMAGYVQADAEAALQAFKDSDMSSVLIDLYQLFRVKQPRSKKEAVEIIKDQDPSLLLPVKYQDPGRPSLLKLFGSYDEFFEDKVGTWKDPLYDAFQRALSAINKILDIYSYPPLTDMKRGNFTGRGVALEGFIQFLDDVKIYKQYNSDEGLKRSRPEIYEAIQHAKDLSNAIIDAGKYLQVVEEYEDDPKMIVGAYQSYNKADRYGITARIDIIMPFLDEIIKRNLDYPEQAAGTNRMRKINDRYFKPLQSRGSKKGFSKALGSYLKKSKVEENKGALEVKKIKLKLNELSGVKISKPSIREGRYEFLGILGRPIPTLDLDRLGAELLSVSGKRIPIAPFRDSALKSEPDLIKLLDDIIVNEVSGESLETLVKKGMSKAAEDEAPAIVTVRYSPADSTPGAARGDDDLIEVHLVISDNGLVAIRTKLSNARRIADSVPKPRKTSDPTTPEGYEERVIEQFKNIKNRNKRLGLQVEELQKIAKETGNPVGSPLNPFPNFATARYFFEGKFGIAAVKAFNQKAFLLSKKYEGLDIWLPAKWGKGDSDYIVIGRPGDPKSAVGFKDGKVTKSDQAGLSAEDFQKDWSGGVERLESSGEDIIYMGFRRGSNAAKIAETWNFPRRLMGFYSQIYAPSSFLAKTPLAKWETALGYIGNAVDVLTASFGFRTIEASFLLLMKETGALKQSQVVSGARWLRGIRQTAGLLMICAQVIGWAREKFNDLNDNRLEIERLELLLSNTTEGTEKYKEIESQLDLAKKGYVAATKDYAKRLENEPIANSVVDVATADVANEELKNSFQQAAAALEPIAKADPVSAIGWAGPWSESLWSTFVGEWDGNGRMVGKKDKMDDDNEASDSIDKAGKEAQQRFPVGQEEEARNQQAAVAAQKQKNQAKADAAVKAEKELKDSGLSIEEFKEWKKSGLSLPDYKENKALEDAYFGELDEHRDLGPILENYLGGIIVKNIKVGSKADPKSGEKK